MMRSDAEQAARELLAVLDQALPHINSAIAIATAHHCPYTGPAVKPAMNRLKEALDAK